MSTLHKILYKDENENQDCMRKLYFHVTTITVESFSIVF